MTTQVEDSLRKWSEDLENQDVEEYAEMTFENKNRLIQEFKNFDYPTYKDFIQKRIKSKKEHGNLEGYYRTRKQTKLPLIRAYRNVDTHLSPHEQNKEELAGLYRKIFYGLNNCKVFSPTDDLYQMLELTDPSDNLLSKPPYPNTFISKIWNRDGMTFWGSMVMTVIREKVYNEDKWQAGEMRPFVVEDDYMEEMPERFFVAHVMGYDHDIGQTFTREMFIPMRDGQNPKEEIVLVNESVLRDRVDEKALEELSEDEIYDELVNGVEENKVEAYKEVALNVKKLFHYINSPNVEYKQKKERHIMDKGNRRRKKKGKEPTQSHSIVTVDGTTKKYLDAVRERGDGFNSTHWVRGHFRVLRDEDYWGDSAGDRIWVRPHVRGDGDLLEQEYQVEN